MSDARMTECLEMKGDWRSVPRDSMAWRQAKLEDSRRKLQRAVEKLGDSTP